jgi:hypothetical protein
MRRQGKLNDKIVGGAVQAIERHADGYDLRVARIVAAHELLGGRTTQHDPAGKVDPYRVVAHESGQDNIRTAAGQMSLEVGSGKRCRSCDFSTCVSVQEPDLHDAIRQRVVAGQGGQERQRRDR